VPFDEPKGVGEFTMCFKRVHDDFKVIPTQFRIQEYKALVNSNGTRTGDEIIKGTLKGYWITALLLQT
jgi:hypothetical protein